MQCITPYNPRVSNVIIPDLMKVEQAQHMMEEVEAVTIRPVIVTHSWYLHLISTSTFTLHSHKG